MIDAKIEEVYFCRAFELIASLLESASLYVGPDTYTGVMHYLEHGEYELAYEGLFIDIMNSEFNIYNVDVESYLSLGLEFNMNNESVLDCHFWERLIEYVSE
jgi:hypothetical protein